MSVKMNMKRFQTYATGLLIILGGVHAVLTAVLSPRFNEQAMWFAGAGLALLLLGMLNWVRLATLNRVACMTCFIANSFGIAYGLLLVIAIADFQAVLTMAALIIVFFGSAKQMLQTPFHEIPEYIRRHPAVMDQLERCDHLDLHSVTAAATLSQALAAILSYHPKWVTVLFGIRWAVVRFLGMRQAGVPKPSRFAAEDVPMKKGQSITFFTVDSALPDHHWVAIIRDRHLEAVLAVFVEPTEHEERTFHLLTIVHYKNWAGPVYFNLILPFHHLIVRSSLASVRTLIQ